MSLERIIKALVSLDLSRLDAEVYVYTAKKGPQRVTDLDMALDYSKKQITTSLRTLIEQGLISKNGFTFFAVPFEEALDLLIKKQREQEKSLEKSKEFVESWNNNSLR